jgi:hypothetical protein
MKSNEDQTYPGAPLKPQRVSVQRTVKPGSSRSLHGKIGVEPHKARRSMPATRQASAHEAPEPPSSLSVGARQKAGAPAS